MGQTPASGDEPTASDDASTQLPATATGEQHPAVTPMRASIAMMIVGALVLFVGMLSTTAASPQPNCPEGTELISKFEVQNGSYVFEKPAGNEQVVSLTYANNIGGDWTSTVPISVVIVKGGPGSKATTYDPAQVKGTFSNATLPPVGSGQPPAISNIQFCAPPTPVTTTTTDPYDTTTTTDPYDTTTTTEATTTTTEEPTTTTTEATTTTTEEPTTTTEATTTTTEDDATTTTIADGTTTTEGPDVAGRVEVSTKVTPNDAEVRSGALAFTGGSSIPLLVIGIAMLLGGATLALVTRARSRQAAG